MNKYILSHPFMELEDPDTVDEEFMCITSAVSAAYDMSKLYGNTAVKIISLGYDKDTDKPYEVTVNSVTAITAPKFDDEGMPYYERSEQPVA